MARRSNEDETRLTEKVVEALYLEAMTLADDARPQPPQTKRLAGVGAQMPGTRLLTHAAHMLSRREVPQPSAEAAWGRPRAKTPREQGHP